MVHLLLWPEGAVEESPGKGRRDCSCSHYVQWLDQERSALLYLSMTSSVFFQHLPFPARILTTGCSSRQWSAMQ